jgi:hypothetical protein
MKRPKIIDCKVCNGKDMNCKACDGYGYNHPPKRKGLKRRLVSGEKFYFLFVMDDEPQVTEDPRDILELNGAGYLIVGQAESYEPSYDRQSNFFFTREEARQGLAAIARIIRRAK